MKEKNNNLNVTYLNNHIPVIKGDTVVIPAQFQFITTQLSHQLGTRFAEISEQANIVNETLKHYSFVSSQYIAKRDDFSEDLTKILHLANHANGTLLLRIGLDGLTKMRALLDDVEKAIHHNVKSCELNDIILVEVGK